MKDRSPRSLNPVKRAVLPKNYWLQLQEEEFAYPEGFTTLEKSTTKYLNLLTF